MFVPFQGHSAVEKSSYSADVLDRWGPYKPSNLLIVPSTLKPLVHLVPVASLLFFSPLLIAPVKQRIEVFVTSFGGRC